MLGHDVNRQLEAAEAVIAKRTVVIGVAGRLARDDRAVDDGCSPGRLIGAEQRAALWVPALFAGGLKVKVKVGFPHSCSRKLKNKDEFGINPGREIETLFNFHPHSLPPVWPLLTRAGIVPRRTRRQKLAFAP